jgi:hypothetical protein
MNLHKILNNSALAGGTKYLLLLGFGYKMKGSIEMYGEAIFKAITTF